MPFEPRKTWYVSFELPKLDLRATTRRSPRQSKTFFTEDEARAFASEKCKGGSDRKCRDSQSPSAPSNDTVGSHSSLDCGKHP